MRVPFYVVPLLTVLAIVGSVTVAAGMGSYSRMLWKAANYNSLRREQDNLKAQYRDLQTQVKDTNQRLNSLQSLAGEVATAYGIARFHQTPFGLTDAGARLRHRRRLPAVFERIQLLGEECFAVTLLSGGMRVLPGTQLGSLGIAPALWPVVGEITGHFGERLDPFSGEGAFHAGMDIASHYGDAIRATADGVVSETDRRTGYGRLIVIDHGFGVTTWYGHLSAFNTQPGTHVKAGDIIGYEGQSGRSTGPPLPLRSSHLQYPGKSLALPSQPLPVNYGCNHHG